MHKRELLKQLNNLKQEIKPDPLWQKKNRDILLSQIKAQTNSDFVFSYKLLFKNIFLATYKPLGSLILIAGILFGTWIATVGAAKKSLPGDFWYGFKLTTERMQVNLTLNDEKRTGMEIAFADRRLDEIQKTTAKDGSAKSNKNLEVTLKNFQESINNVKSNLVKLEASDKQAALKVADLIDEKTKSYVGILKDQQDQNPQLIASKDAQQAISVSKATGDKALSVILEEFEAGGSGLKIDDLKQKINARIDDLDKSIAAAKGDIDKIIVNKKIADEAAAASAAAKALADKKALEDKKAAESAVAKALADKEAAANAVEEAKPETTTTENETANTANNNANTNINADINADANTNSQPEAQNINSSDNTNQNDQAVSQPEEVLPTIDEIKDKPKEAEVLLAKAKDFLKSGSVSQAFDLVQQADDIVTLVEKVIKANGQYLEAPAVQSASGDKQAEIKPEETKI
ncbi:MAG: DUF5667 domain-containing protein [Candidatus Parcubacteria bacterium]|nr:DUF5667 domain-containing protein [Candidatus Parcubacteria bacterium]